ncbi:MAG: hypothetical protein ACI9TH_003395 [Kiritimatiellia bacterium]|jgi:uncharacterized protein (DUF1800 family)
MVTLERLMMKYVISFFSVCLLGPLSLAQVFIQDTLTDGIVVFEAQDFTLNEASGAHAWEPVTLPRGETAMHALPNDGTVINDNFIGTSPRLDYQVAFNRAGTHYVVLRGYGENSSDNSIHVGINGQFVDTSDRMRENEYELGWSNDTADNIIASLEVPSAGVHTINIWMREDGYFLQRILLSSTPNFVPHGEGPPLSLKQGETSTGSNHDPQRAELYGTRFNANLVLASIQPGVAVETYRLLESDSLSTPMTPAAQVTFDGLDLLIDASGKSRAFFSLEAIPVEAEQVLTGLAVNRLAYGPTPDLLDHIGTIGCTAWINEQLSSETLPESVDNRPDIQVLIDRLHSQNGTIRELQAWHCLRAIHADRQLMEVLLQFINNHFVTYSWKTRDYFNDELGISNSAAQSMAASLELWEMDQWRKVLLDPNGTFYDLLKISIESATMIIYLDTIENEKSAPNENYARELLELFTMGVDNGYKQVDIEEMAKVWTGWRIALAHPADTNVPPLAYTPTELITEHSSNWLWRKGSSEPAANWREAAFVPGTNWMTGQTVIGYGGEDHNTDVADMRNAYSTLYFRHTFNVADPSALEMLTLRLYIDDGCVAYINDQVVGTHNRDSTDGLTFESTADDAQTNGEWVTIVLNDPAAILQAGNNVLAVHGLNIAEQSRDFYFDAQLIAGPQPEYRVTFDPDAHSTSNKTIFAGYAIDPRFGPDYANLSYELNLPERSGMEGMQDGYDAIAHLANLPYTMEFLSIKLCRLFVHDSFEHGYYYNVSSQSAEAELIRACMTTWDTPGPDGRKGNLRSVLATIFNSELFQSQSAVQQKVKTPLEYMVSAIRALKTDVGGSETASTDGFDLLVAMDRAGMEPFARVEPNGWSELGIKWIDTGTVVERLRFIQQFMMATDEPMKQTDYGSGGTDNQCDPVALILDRVDAGAQSDADAITDYLLGRIFPGVGHATLAQEARECVSLLNSDASGTASPFSNLAIGGPEYENRLRSVVALLLSSPRFHEQ